MTTGGTRRNLAPGPHLEDRVPPAPRADYARRRRDAGGMSGRSALELAAVVTLGIMLVLFIVDIEIRVSALQEHVGGGLSENRHVG